MKLNLSFPATGLNKQIEVEDEKKVRFLYEKRMAQEVEADPLGAEWKGYVFRITGGNDKQGFPMMQGILTTNRVRLLLKKGSKCYRPRKAGERRRKSIRGCIVDANLSVINLMIVKKGEQEIEGLTDSIVPRIKGPKRADKLRKLFNLTKEDDVTKYRIMHEKTTPSGKVKKVGPKIQRLVTARTILHARQIKNKRLIRRQNSKEAAAAYAVVLAKYREEQKERKRSLSRSSHASKDANKK